MNFFDKVNNWTQILLYMTVVICVFILLGAVIYYFYKNKKKRMKEDSTDYSNLNRKESADFLKFDDIREDMIITDNGYRFVGAIVCYGFDFYSAQATEQMSTLINFEEFVDIMDKPISYRQFSKIVDMEDTLEDYNNALASVEELLYIACEDKNDLVKLLKNGKKLNKEEMEIYEKKLAEVERQISAYEFRKFHLEDQIRYISENSGSGTLPEEVQTWIFEWQYNSLDFMSDLSKEEIYIKAKEELKAIANAKIYALGNCGVRARRCNTEELIEMFRYYSSPISAARYKLRDIMDSNFFEDIVTSDSKGELLEASEKEMERKLENDILRSLEEL